MSSKSLRRGAPAAVSALMFACLAFTACGAPPHLQPGSFGWADYAVPALGLALSYPDVYVPQAEGDAYVAFRHGRFMPLIIRFVDEADGRQRGLWFGHPAVNAIDVGAIAGQEYVYTHYDGPFGARMIACVIPWKGKYLALEFRTNEDLDAVQQEILKRAALSGS
jgi:hypothetical protein